MDRNPVIAIVGMGCAFPQAHTPEAFWELILEGKDTVETVTNNRWGLDPQRLYAAGDPSSDRVYALSGCFVDHAALQLDFNQLNLNAEALERMDPLFKVALYAAQQAWLDSRHDQVDRARVGVLIGNIVLPSETSSGLTRESLGQAYLRELKDPVPTAFGSQTDPRNRRAAGLPAGFVADAMRFGGGCFTLDAACASSLYAVHMAAESLRSGRVDAMITGGLSRPDSLYTQMGFSQLRALSSKGFSTPFDHRADGLIVGEGAGFFVLKRLEDALAHGDHIHGVLGGAGLSNDRDGSLLAPSSEGQLRAMRAAYDQAGWQPDEVSMIECHATGTPLGDRVEFESMQALWKDASPERRAVIGSVKSNIGHLLTAAGSASLMKVLLAMRHQTLPPTARFQQEPSEIPLGKSPFRVLQQAEPWESDIERKAAVSAFGFGGINAHLLVSEWKTPKALSQPTGNKGPFQPIAIVGLATRFGPLTDPESLAKVYLGLEEPPQPTGLKTMGWEAANDLHGYPIESLDIPLGAFRIPPNELREMLPQQLLMLDLARQALEDCSLSEEQLAEAGVFLGIGLDANTANFQLRWYLEQMAQQWLQSEHAAELDREAWIQTFKEGLGPALNANRVVGALGGMVASRLAREFRVGGPSFTISSEETSGLASLESAVRALHAGTIGAALVGAVDFGCDPRQAVALHQERGALACDGGAVLVLKRLGDAVKADDTIYAVIDGVGSANLGATGSTEQARKTSIARAQTDAEANLGDEAKGSLTTWSDNQKATEQKLGHAGAAQGLRHFAAGVLALHYRVKPDVAKAQYWIRNREDGPRRLLLEAHGADGTSVCVQVSESNAQRKVTHLIDFSEQVFLFRAADVDDLVKQVEQLENLALNTPGALPRLAQEWWHTQPKVFSQLRLGMTVKSQAQLLNVIPVVKAYFLDAMTPEQEETWLALTKNKTLVFSEEKPVDPAQVAFVFPGSGSQFPEMGRLLGLHFPHIFDVQDQLTESFASQMRPDLFWNHLTSADLHHEHRALLSAQVALGVTTHDIVGEFGIDPKAVIGYSLGESSALFSTRAWIARDEMHRRTQTSNLFRDLLAGECRAVHQHWGLDPDEQVDWMLGVVNRPADQVKEALASEDRVYLLIINTPGECVIGGQRDRVHAVVNKLEARLFPLHGVVTVHCEVLEPAAQAYHDHHLFETNPPEGISFYSGGWGKRFEVSRESAAKAILQQARHGVDFPKTVRAAYEDGFRVFVEMGPGGSCTRMIADILEDQPHHALSVSKPGPKAIRHFLRGMAQLFVLGLDISLDPMFLGLPTTKTSIKPLRTVTIPVERGDLKPPTMLEKKEVGMKPMTRKAAPVKSESKRATPPVNHPAAQPQPIESPAPAVTWTGDTPVADPVLDGFGAVALASHGAHRAFLELSRLQEESLQAVASFQMAIIEQADGAGEQIAMEVPPAAQPIAPEIPTTSEETIVSQPRRESLAFDRDLCMEFAVGNIGNVLGPEFAKIDAYPTRVRLPDEPLMLVDRILEIEGERMTRGRVVTEHDVKFDGWYLDGGRIPTCIAVEAGQADLFLSAYLGIDFETKGLATYRLLDAEVTFHDELPQAGKVIHYDISIENFFRQGKTYLFRFRFDGTVDGKPLLTMRNGCAGFFSEAELAAGKGIVRHAGQVEMKKQRAKGIAPLVPMVREAYDDQQLQALRDGNLEACFGPAFANLPLQNPMTLPDGTMNLVDRVLILEPQGGPYGMGFIRAEADIHPDDWFLTCHFVDDKVMPGTLMYECCLHSLRIYLMRMGWLGEEGQVAYQPIPGVKSQLKCRGQVLETTKKVRYEIMIRELGYGPEPYAIVDALMYSDDKCIVEIGDMSIRLTGLNQDAVEALWQSQEATSVLPVGSQDVKKTALYDTASILAFAIGKPSEAFGEPYRVFDEERVIARLPGPPFMLIDRITHINTPAWQVEAGGTVQAQYDVPADAWYFAENLGGIMPFSVLLEIALQPCGWMAGYMGSALTSDIDLKFRNLGGTATMMRPVLPHSGTLTINIAATKVSSSGGMIIQNYDFEVRDAEGPVYVGDTYFGFFSKTALANQVGLRDAVISDTSSGEPFPYPDQAPYPATRMRMLDRITQFLPHGGEQGAGFIAGEMDVDPSAWFFKAHFYQDPVVPGSLGLESFLQLLKIVADDRWQLPADAIFETTACGLKHAWEYRGQVIPTNKLVKVEAQITRIDDAARTIVADGILSVDGTAIYRMKDFSLRVAP